MCRQFRVMQIFNKYVNHACMNEHIFENLYGEQPCMSKNSALQRRFCE